MPAINSKTCLQRVVVGVTRGLFLEDVEGAGSAADEWPRHEEILNGTGGRAGCYATRAIRRRDRSLSWLADVIELKEAMALGSNIAQLQNCFVGDLLLD